MIDSSTTAEDFIADAEYHNPWWSGTGGLEELHSVSEWKERSDLHRLLDSLEIAHDDGVDSLVHAMYGQTGIGKTTMLRQLVAALIDDDAVSYAPGNRERTLVGSVAPRQVLYIPLEESLYHLEPPEIAFDRLQNVVDYFDSHVAPRRGTKFVILDDIGALSFGEDDGPERLQELVDDRTYLFITGIVSPQVDVDTDSWKETVDQVTGSFPMLPTKFIDAVKQGHVVDFEDEHARKLSETLEHHQVDGLIHRARKEELSSRNIAGMVDALSTLFFDELDTSDHDTLHEAARAYLRRGGSFHSVERDTVRNDLVKSHFLLYLYKELARYHSVQRPENLHRLGSLAASKAGEELKYTTLSEQLGVDRRTVDSYLSILEGGLAVGQSHDFALQRYRRTRLYLRDPRHVVLLSQRREHHGFETYTDTGVLNAEFEHALARTAGFDHAKRLAWSLPGESDQRLSVEYAETESGTVDYVLHGDGLVLPFVLSYQPFADGTLSTVLEFDPSTGAHFDESGEELRELTYEAPYRFVVTDALPREVEQSSSLVVDHSGTKVCYLPYWLFLLLA
ncbi:MULTISPECIES: DUF4143 domain-containing protein [Haloferax]|uniref:AAA family ATPase n=1 Tax=Haloferax marinum TaxID=2666143 RepID=A0A6A8GC11_9EURY|nr:MULTISPECIES: AAA family ATPase [Haloferax]KAB1190756.1 AAA family ATPase [Haloferax sp. CBA1150]MRW98295.1 AAA family ATPase [Haloferax marinum]